MTIPSTMKAWQFSSVAGGLEKNLFRPATGVPTPRISDTQLLVRVHSMALNPADYKVAELGLISRLIIPSPCTPGMDFCGRVVEVGAKVDWMRVGEMVFGTMDSKQGQGTLGQYVAVGREMCAALPEGVEVNDAAGIGCAGLTAYQCIVPYVKEEDKVFVNGGSGGMGVWSIQIAKALGCHVTASCSGTNAEFCKGLGADEVIDYRSVDLVKSLRKMGQVFDLIVDNVGSPSNLYQESNEFLKPIGQFMQVGLAFGLGTAGQLANNWLKPGFLGGGKAKYSAIVRKHSNEQLAKLGDWLKEGKIHTVNDEIFAFEDAPKAFEKLKTGRAKGKIIVKVADEAAT